MDSLFEKFNRYAKTGTPAEKRLARYYLEHPEDVSFETAAAVADRLDLSPMTVGRFLRGAEIDTSLAPQARSLPLPPEPVAAIPGIGEPQREFGHMPDQAELIQQIGALCGRPAWRGMIEEMNRAEEVHIAAGGVSRPLAALFAWRLSEVRSGIRLLEGTDGIFMELLGSNRNSSLLILLDDRTAQPRFDRLCRAARKAGHRVLYLTYAERTDLSALADLIIQLPAAQRGTGLDPLATTALIELAVHAIAGARGAEASERAHRMAELRNYFSRPEDGHA